MYKGFELRVRLGVVYIYRVGRYVGCRRSEDLARSFVDQMLSGEDPDRGR